MSSQEQTAKVAQLESYVAELEDQTLSDKQKISELTDENLQYQASYERLLGDNESLTSKISELQNRLDSSTGEASKQKLLQLEEELASTRQKHQESVLKSNAVMQELDAAKASLDTTRDEINYLKEKVCHAEKLTRDSEALLGKKEKEMEIKNAKLRKQDCEISHLIDQRSDLKSKITTLVKSNDKFKIAKELAEQRLIEEKMRTTELSDIVDELQDAEQCNDGANEAQLLEEQRKRMEKEKALDKEKQKTSTLEETIARMCAEMEAMRSGKQTSKDGDVLTGVEDQEEFEQSTSKCSLGEINGSDKSQTFNIGVEGPSEDNLYADEIVNDSSIEQQTDITFR